MSRNTSQTKLFFGRLLCGPGIVLAVIGAFFVSIATNVPGVVAYALGPRRLGTLTIVLALLTLAGGLSWGRVWCRGLTTGSWTGAPSGSRRRANSRTRRYSV